jgi:hypothetical protein
MTQWHYAVGEQQLGPVSTDELRRLAATGQVGPETMVWCNGMADWAEARSVAGLTFGSPTPEPMPAPDPYAAAAPAAPQPQYAPAAAYQPAQATYPQPSYAQPAYAAGPYGQAGPAQPAYGSPLSYASPGQGPLSASPRALEMLRQTRPWVLFLSILMFIGIGLYAVMGIFYLIMSIGLASSMSSRSAGGAFAGMGILGAAVMLGVGLLYFMPAMFLSRYAARINDVVRMRREADLERALEAQKSFWKFIGVMTLIVIGIYVVMFLILAVGAASFR